MRKRVAGLEIFAFAMLTGLLFTFVLMALERVPAETYGFVSMAAGGFILLVFVDRIVSARCPSRSITEGGRISIVGVLCYIFGLTILSVVFTVRPVNDKVRALEDAMHLYGGAAGGILLLCSVCSFLYVWRMLPNIGSQRKMSKQRTYENVPSNIEECFEELKRILSTEQLAEFKAQASGVRVIGAYHMWLGRWIRNNWGLWHGSKPAGYFVKMGVSEPDDMSCTILESFWRHLNGIDIRLEEQLERYKRYWDSAP